MLRLRLQLDSVPPVHGSAPGATIVYVGATDNNTSLTIALTNAVYNRQADIIIIIGETFTIAGNPLSDAGCTKLTATTEYCEIGFGGTSLASPLLAGMFAVVNQARLAAGKPLLGFANPFLYAGKSAPRGLLRPSTRCRHPTKPLACCAATPTTPCACGW